MSWEETLEQMKEAVSQLRRIDAPNPVEPYIDGALDSLDQGVQYAQAQITLTKQDEA